ncbi:12-oxophytodienoate reductase, partial [Globisporangium polare]
RRGLPQERRIGQAGGLRRCRGPRRQRLPRRPVPPVGDQQAHGQVRRLVREPRAPAHGDRRGAQDRSSVRPHRCSPLTQWRVRGHGQRGQRRDVHVRDGAALRARTGLLGDPRRRGLRVPRQERRDLGCGRQGSVQGPRHGQLQLHARECRRCSAQWCGRPGLLRPSVHLDPRSGRALRERLAAQRRRG